MKRHIHTRLDDGQAKNILERHVAGALTADEAREKLGLKRSRFYELLKSYRERGEQFELRPVRTHAPRRIPDAAEEKIIEELESEKQLIEKKDMPIRTCNYSALRDLLREKHGIAVSVPTIISRAKQHGYYLGKKERRTHDRMVISDFAGELVQHDSSYHQWSPFMDEKLWLITSLDDFTRVPLYADFVERETSWYHIAALQSVFSGTAVRSNTMPTSTRSSVM